MFNAHLTLVIDNFSKQGKSPFLSENIDSIFYDKKNKKYDIAFKNGKEYSYGENRITILKNPCSLDPKNFIITREKKSFSDITDIFEFKNEDKKYWHIVFKNGKEKTYDFCELCVEKSCLENERSKNIFEYLKALAKTNNLKNDENKSLLLNSYEKIRNVKENSALAVFLNPQKFKNKTYNCPDLIFPFGCNSSQMQAVESALKNQITIISGPPGTGKTQTILNIIANLLVQGKTIQVVSNNNSATENVLEKLQKYQLDFIAAFLGSKENKEKFIETQNALLPKYLEKKRLVFDALQKEKLSMLYRKLQDIFKTQEKCAKLKAELSELVTEKNYFLHAYKADAKMRKNLSAKDFLEILCLTEKLILNKKRISLWHKFKVRFVFGISGKNLWENSGEKILLFCKNQFYIKKEEELKNQILRLENKITQIDAKKTLCEFSEASLERLQTVLAKRYDILKPRKIFSLEDLYKKSKEFQECYPLVLSTTFSARNSLQHNTEFDYVIMDEASQVDIATGCLALSNANSAVIVGDLKQLPRVLTLEDKIKIESVVREFSVSESYNSAKYSFLESLKKVVPEIPETLLREHYRCDPKIINFCNQKFYGANLIVMSEEKTKDAISVLKTVEGNHARGKANQREADEILKILSEEKTFSNEQIGIITPYNDQADLIRKMTGAKIDVSTVHKFQGREKDFIIISAVDNVPTEFSDDPNLLNVAVSRAKKKLMLVVSKNADEKKGNIADLVSYIEYNSGKIESGKIRSVFDYLYSQYNFERRQFLKGKKRVSSYDSENLFFETIQNLLKSEFPTLGVILHKTLKEIILDTALIKDERLLKYALNPWTHIDFLVYNKVSKLPVLAIEVDGWNFHLSKKQSAKLQAKRDKMKDEIFLICKIPFLRLPTNGSCEMEKVRARLVQKA